MLLRLFPREARYQTRQRTASLRSVLARILTAGALCTSGLLEADEHFLDRAEQVRNLSAAEAAQSHPVRLRGIVTYYDPEAPDLFIQDESAGTYVFCDGRLPIERGQQIELSGITDAGDFAPVVVHPKTRTLNVDSVLPSGIPENPGDSCLKKLQENPIY